MSGGPSSIHPDTIDRQLADIHQRLAMLERTSTTLASSSIDSPDADEEVVVEFGALTTQSVTTNKDSLYPDGSLGLGVYDYVGTERVPRLRVSNTRGVELPKTHTGWIRGDTHPSVSVSSASWVTAWSSTMIGGPDSDTLTCEWFVDVPTGTTLEMKLENLATTISTDTLTEVGAPGSSTRKVRWIHGIPLEDVTGATWQWRLRCRRTAGAGTSLVYEPTPLVQGVMNGATSGGVYQ